MKLKFVLFSFEYIHQLLRVCSSSEILRFSLSLPILHLDVLMSFHFGFQLYVFCLSEFLVRLKNDT